MYFKDNLLSQAVMADSAGRLSGTAAGYIENCFKTGLKVYFDKNTFEIKSFGLNGNTYNYSDLENALNTIMESKIAAINERIAYLGDNHPIVPGLKEDIERVKEQYSAGNITEITVEDGYIAFKLDDNPRPIYVNYDGSTVSSIEYYTGGGPYINGYSHIDV